MALFRQVIRSSSIISKCQRLAVANHQACRHYSDAAEMPFTFASPSDMYYRDATNVKQVDVPSLSGTFGILPHHVPTLAALKPGLLTVFEADGTAKKFFVSSGTVTVNSDSSVQILAEEAHPLDRLDINAIRESLTKAEHELAAASTDQSKAEAKIAVDCLEALNSAVQ